MDYTIKIGGEAGQGIQTIGETLARVLVRAGYRVFTYQDYESRIRGGHNFYQIRVSDLPVSAPREKADILVALDRESISRHETGLAKNGRILYDSSLLGIKRDGASFFDIPYRELAVKSGGQPVMENSVATGVVLGLLGLDIALLLENLGGIFRKKGEAVVAGNRNAARAGYEHAVRNCSVCSFRLPAADRKPRMLINGVDAIALGALASGCRFYAAYPMTPSTGIMNYLASRQKEHAIVVEQAEDEIAAINMALGASFAGVRAMTGTSGGGFSLMVEGLSLAGMTETPVVIALGQRPGPATGFPTRTEQGDLSFALSAGHGEFPRVIFAPGTPAQAFYCTTKAFDLSEKYQIPAIVLFDAYLADAQWTVEGFDTRKIRAVDHRLRGQAFAAARDYRRHLFTDTGVSPFAIPGDARHVVVTDSDEHDESGHMVEDAETRIRMVQKRVARKLPDITREMAPPFVYGDHEPETVLVGWGSTFGVLKEAVDVLSKSRRIAMLHFSELFPLPAVDRFDYLRLLSEARTTICVEQNATGQFGRLVRSETGHEFDMQIHKFDGRPFILDELVSEINEQGKSAV